MMPVRKFRSVEEMEPAPWRRPGDPALFRAIALVWEFGDRTRRRSFSTGVFRFRSIEEMKRTDPDLSTTGEAAGPTDGTAPAR